MRTDYLASIFASALSGAALAMLGIYGFGRYGWALFCALPVAMGFVASAVLRMRGRQPLTDSIVCSFGGALVASSAFLFFGKEGLVCIFLAIPIALPFLLIGALLGWFAFHRKRFPVVSSAAMLIAVVGCMAIESNGAQPLEIVEDSILVSASPARVWDAIVKLDRIPQPSNWMYRAGVACPLRTRIESKRAGGYRVCTLSTGQLVEQIEVWKPERTLRWHARVTPPPMRELNPFYDHVDAPHLNGFYESPRGEFAIERFDAHRTRLTRRTWYSQRLYPSKYWAFFAEAAISQIHRTVLEHVRDMAEGRVGV